MTHVARHSDGPRHTTASVLATIGPIAITILLALGWSLLVRWPFLVRSGPDDGFFTEVALLWREGHLPYVAAFDLKPPGFFAALAVSQSLFGTGFAALRAIGVLSDAATMTAMILFGRRAGLTGVGLFAAIVFPWMSQKIVGDDSYSLLMALTTLAMAVGLSGMSIASRAVMAGFLIGAACLVKQTAALEALALLVILITSREAAGRRILTVALVIAGASVLPLVCLSYFAVHGALAVLLTDVVGIAIHRPGSNSDNVSFADGLLRFALFAMPLAPVLFVAVRTSVTQFRTPKSAAPIAALSAWFIATLAGVLMQHALLPTYLGPLLPPSLLLCGFGLAEMISTPMARRIARFGLAALVLVEALATIHIVLTLPPSNQSTVDRLAAAIKSTRPENDDRLYVIASPANSVWLYARAGLLPATPFLIPSQSMCDFPNVGPARIHEAFATHPRFVVTAADLAPYPCEVEGSRAYVTATLQSDYRHISQIDADGDAYDLYEIKPKL